jgi:putative transposase
MLQRVLHPLFALLASVTRQDLARQVTYLKEENRILRARLPKVITVTATERKRLLKLGRKLGAQLKELISIVCYGTFLRWIRNETGRAETKKEPTRKPGPPRTPDDIREIVLKLARENAWGYTRILGELRKLGINSISRQTVKNILKEHDLEPGPLRGEGTWDEFLKIHAATLWQCDFATKKMWTIRGCVDLYFLVFVHLGTRRSWISPCTLHPDSAWTCQQARNFLMHAEDVELPPKYVMRDNDVKYTTQFDEVFRASDTEIKRNTPASPNLRAHVERFIQTLQVECLDKFVVVNEKHLNLITREFQGWYNHERPHSARDHLPPACESPPAEWETAKLNDVVCETRLGGALKTYWRRAA